MKARTGSGILLLIGAVGMMAQSIEWSAKAADTQPVASGPPVKTIASFENGSPFSGGDEKAPAKIVEEHAAGGKKALRIDRSWVSMDGNQNWLGYDYLKMDCYTDAKEPMTLGVEIRDKQSTDYYTRVNYETVIPPGQSTFSLPLKQLYVGEKSRPGRPVILDGITRLVFGVGDKPAAPLFISNVRLERDDSLQQMAFEGLKAFSLGLDTSPLMEGFTKITPGTLYSKGRGYGLQNAKVWRAFNVLQPDPLYQSFICIESGGLAVDVPNGKYHLFVNIDNPSGYWGEYQTYKIRKVLAQDKEVAVDTMDLGSFCKKYFRFWDTEDLPTENTFDKYQTAYFQEKQFDVDVQDGQLKIDFQGENYGCSVSCVIAYPVEKAAEGEKFLNWVKTRRRFYFDNYFKRILHTPTGDPVQAAADDQKRGYVVFSRDIMKDVYYNDTPFKNELAQPFTGNVFAGEYAPVTVAVRPLQDLGRVTLTMSGLSKGNETIPASAIDVGYASYRVSRVNYEGSVYTISPRYVIPKNTVVMPKDITREFWLTVKTPANAAPGTYKGVATLKAEKGGEAQIPVELTVRNGTLDPVDMPAGPIGGGIGLPFNYYQHDSAARQWEQDILLKSLKRMREYGFTTFSGSMPQIAYKGFKDGKPVLDFGDSDKWMKVAKELGFLAVLGYGSGVSGLLGERGGYTQDTGLMNAAGFKDYSEFIKAIYTEVQRHADENGWLPVYYNLGDENPGDDTVKNAEAYRKAFPKGPPYFTALFSFAGKNTQDKAFLWSKALHIAGWNGHDEDGVKLLHDAGNDWGFYNGGCRWTFGDYLYKAVKQFGLKFRNAWCWNNAAGDPYYALDSREDDYCWCNATSDGQLIPSIFFERRLGRLSPFADAGAAVQRKGGNTGGAGRRKVDRRSHGLLQTRPA